MRKRNLRSGATLQGAKKRKTKAANEATVQTLACAAPQYSA
jgi:hypothetical protein